MAEEPAEKWLTPGVLSVGLSSLGSDAGHEMTTSLLPTFVTSTLHASAAGLGVIEGVSDALIGLSKLAGGPLSNNPTQRARIARGGYLMTAIATGLVGLATSLWEVAILRAIAWASRGLRSPARDTLLVSLVTRASYGRASGVERAGDNLGALIGPLMAAALVGVVGIRHTLLLAFVPGVFAAVAITVAAREAGRVVAAPESRRTLSFNLGELRQAGFARVLASPALFELGNLATTLLILRATEILQSHGRSATAATAVAILMYAGYNTAATISSLIAGACSDRFGPRIVFSAGTLAYVASYAFFATGPHSVPSLVGTFLLAGIGIGCAETAESTMVAHALPDRLRGNGYGLLGLVQAFGDLGATLVAGLLWTFVSPALAFGYAAAWMLASLIAQVVVTPRATPFESQEPSGSWN